MEQAGREEEGYCLKMPVESLVKGKVLSCEFVFWVASL